MSQTITSTSTDSPLSLTFAPPSSTFIETHLCYSQLPLDNSKPYNYINPPTDGRDKTNMPNVDIPSKIYDIRSLPADSFNTDNTGFDFQTFPSNMTYQDWESQEKIQQVYYPQVEAFLKKFFKAHTIHIFDNTVRRAPPDNTFVPDTPTSRQPVSRVHVDQTPESAVNRVRRHLPSDAERLLKGRYRLVNVWRPFHTVYDIPLAVGDYRTLSKKDLVPTDLIYPDRVGETYTVLHSEGQKFYWPSQQEEHEVILIKCFDSKALEEGNQDVALLTPHTAFEDPRYVGKEGVRKRESIELRCLVFSEE